MAIERSLILLKPDCLDGRYAGEVISRFEKAGFTIREAKVIELTTELLKEHYAHIADRPFFPEIVEFMSSRPVLAMVLEGENAISGIRDMLGPTDSSIAPAGTIRGDLGTTSMKNICHASDSVEAAEVEEKRFFGE